MRRHKEPVDRLGQTFARRQREGGSALVTYLMGGDPTPAASLTMALACIEGGADLLEIGFPFSDPIADGATIQRAAQRSLEAGTTLLDCLSLAAKVRQRSEIPIVLMGYLNPVLAFGPEKFLRACRRSGVDALILPDLPPEEASELNALAAAEGVALIFLLAPTSTPERWQTAFSLARGFLYYVSVAGVTGARASLPADLGQRLDRVRAKSPVPVVVGFGISGPEQARALASHADGVVVGSAIVSRIAAAGPLSKRAREVTDFVRRLKRAVSAKPAK